MKRVNPILWRIKWIWRYCGPNYGIYKKHEEMKRFTNLTGLHHCYIYNHPISDDEIISVQARKIKGLETAINQQRRGYLKKVARLEKRIIELQAMNLPPVEARGNEVW